MAVAFDAYSQSNGSGVDPVTFTHTPVGTPRGIIVFIRAGNNADVVNGVTYGGTAMTETSVSPLVNASGETLRSTYCYFLGSSIPTGAQTVSVDMTATGHSPNIGCISLTAGADTEIQDIEIIDSDSLENPSATLSLGGKSSFCAIAFNSGAGDVTGITPLTDWTSRNEGDHGAQVSAIYTYDTVGTADVTAGWTQVADDALAIAIAITEVSGSTYTLTADAGSYAITGTAASLEFGREVAADAGSYAITGQTATLVHGYPITAAAGSYAITGTAAALEHGWEIAAGAGAYTITGTAATLVRNLPLAAGAGSYSITGSDASLEFGREIAAEAGAYVITGFDATLTYAPGSGATPRTLTLTGAGM